MRGATDEALPACAPTTQPRAAVQARTTQRHCATAASALPGETAVQAGPQTDPPQPTASTHLDPYAASLKHPLPSPPQPARHGHFTRSKHPSAQRSLFLEPGRPRLHKTATIDPCPSQFLECVSSRSCSSSAWQGRASLSSSVSLKTQRNSSETNNASGHFPCASISLYCAHFAISIDYPFFEK